MSGYPHETCLVLLVEDESVIAISLQDEMEAAGYVVAGPFATCAQALTWLETQTPDLAVLDVILQDGTCKDIASELTRRNVPFIIYSGHRQSRNAVREFADCVWIEKPTPHETVLNALAELRMGPAQKHG